MQCGQCSFVCPHSVIRAKYFDERELDGAPATLQVGAGQCPRLSRRALHAAVLRRGLHGMRPVRRGLPGRQPARVRRQGHQHGAEGAARWSRSARISHSLKRLPVNDRARVDFANVRGVQFLRAAVRVLRRLRRLRRDALSQAAVAALRRPAAGRQRHRLLVHLWRQSAGHAVDQRRGGPRSGLVELAVRGQRRVRARLPPGCRQAS